MPLDLQRLASVRPCSIGFRAACPACRENGEDRKGEHLLVRADGSFGCAAHPGDRSHRRRVFELAGAREQRQPHSKTHPRRSSRRAKLPRRDPRKPLQEALVAAAARHLGTILRDYATDDWRADLWHASPIRLDGPSDQDWSLMIECLFPPDAILFLGDLQDSGENRGRGHFRKVEEWLCHPSLPGPRIAPSTFRPGTLHRSKHCIESSPYLVIESDDLIGHKPKSPADCEQNKAASAALLRWLVSALGMRLAAVIDTGNRSLHGWIRMPRRPGMTEELGVIASALRLDRNLLRQPNAPLRLPGALHEKTGNPARLLYLDRMT